MAKENDFPLSWAERQAKIKRKWTTPFLRVEWLCEWISYRLSKWSFIDVLDYGGRLAVVVTAISYLFQGAEREEARQDARKSKHYQAWQAITLAQGQKGNGGRFDALQDLNKDGISLAGVNLSSAVLSGIVLTNASMYSTDVSDSLLAHAKLKGADLSMAMARKTQFAHADLRGVNLLGADLEDASLIGADLAGADLSGTRLVRVNMKDVRNWKQIKSLKGAEISNLVDPPADFLSWATNKMEATMVAATPSTPQPVVPPATPPRMGATGGKARTDVIKKHLRDNNFKAFTNDVSVFGR